MGRELLQAKQELPHGEFLRMVENDLPFSIRTAERYMAIASADHLQSRHTVATLPASSYTLDVLQRLDPATFDAAVKTGKVHPEMTRAEAEALLPAHKTAPVVPISDAARESLDAAMSHVGQRVADFVERQLDQERESDRSDQQLPPASVSIAAESLALDAISRLRRLHALLKYENPKPAFEYRWAEAMRLAQAIVKQLEGLFGEEDVPTVSN